MSHLILTDFERYLFNQGNYFKAYEKMGSHLIKTANKTGFYFQVWIPNVKAVYVVGDFNNWTLTHLLTYQQTTELWHGFIEDVKIKSNYKYAIITQDDQIIYKADPFAFYCEKPPATASVTYDLDQYHWQDDVWMKNRKKHDPFTTPFNIYEVHLGSWRLKPDKTNYDYIELADILIPYVKDMGYTHIELMPIMEHPFAGSWGYQTTGYYAPTSRFGTPDGFMYFIDKCHQANIGVILDWVCSHFCRDEHGLGLFNSSKLYEINDHPQWGTYNFDYGNIKVRNFLIANAFYWLDKYHIDGFRVDGVTSMLYLNYGITDETKKRFNDDGSDQNRDAIAFLQLLNQQIGTAYPDVIMIAEESTAYPLVTYPISDNGLGFHFKWDMGWMNDTLRYLKTDFNHRHDLHHLLTFSLMYTFNENFILPLSHDEVVHGKASLISKMPGDYWRQFAGLRLLAFYQIAHPGAKLNFMGNEIGQFIEWRYFEEIEWFLINYESHQKHHDYIRSLNHLYLNEPGLFRCDHSWQGFDWIDPNNDQQSIISFIRHGINEEDDLLFILNFQPDTYPVYRIGVNTEGYYHEIFNSDHLAYGGSNKINNKIIKSEPIPHHGHQNSITVQIPPLGGIVIKRSKV